MAIKKVKWQVECLEKIKNQNNVILSSPTGSGKTEVFLEWAINKKNRPIYITSPIKALSNQRYRELLSRGYKVGIETGDIKSVPEDCDFICCTQEIYTNKYASLPNSTLIIDEFHYISDNLSRSRTYIDALKKSKAENILLCSATLGDMEELKKYVERISKRDFYTYESKERLTELIYRGYISKENIKDALVVAFSRKNCINVSNQIFSQRRETSKEEIDKIQEIAKKYNINLDSDIIELAKRKVSYYIGSMLPKEKLFIEELFELKLIDTVVGTDALALGVNFPVQNVIFTQLIKYKKDYNSIISKNLFEQLSGRAGRKGYFDTGYVYYCSDFEIEKGTNEIYMELLRKKKENLTIILTPNICEILQGKTTIEEEALFIKEYSTEILNMKTIQNEIRHKIEYIERFNLVTYALNREFIEEESTEEVDYKTYADYILKKELEEKKEERKKELELLEEEFRENIKDVYFDEFTPQENCHIFADILLGHTVRELIQNYAVSFNEKLQLRKYLRHLPKKYRKNLDILELTEEINNIDETALNLNTGILQVQEIEDGIEEYMKKKQKEAIEMVR